MNPRLTPSLRSDNYGFKGYLVVDENTDIALYYTVDSNVREDVILILDGADNPAFLAVGRENALSFAMIIWSMLAIGHPMGKVAITGLAQMASGFSIWLRNNIIKRNDKDFIDFRYPFFEL